MPKHSWRTSIVLTLFGFAVASVPGAAAERQQVRNEGRKPYVSYLLQDAGLRGSLKTCDQYPPTEVGACKRVHDEIVEALQDVVVGLPEQSRRYVKDYLDGRFEPLIECLRSGCGGNFIMEDGSGAKAAESWQRMLAYQACIHAAPATWQSDQSFAFAAEYRYLAAVRGQVPDCPIARLSKQEIETLSHFNGKGY